MRDIALRIAGPSDVAAIRALTRAAYAPWVPVIGREPRPVGADHDAAVRDHRVDLAHVGSELVGLIHTIAHPDHLLVENLAVAPASQGLGVGSLLLAHAEASAPLGCVWLYTNGAFAKNLRFYARCGYRVDREEPFAGGTVVHLRRDVVASNSVPVVR